MIWLKDARKRNPKVQAKLDAAKGPGGDTARWLADLVRTTLKDPVEDVYHTMPTWASGEGPAFVHVQIYADHANLGLSNGWRVMDADTGRLLEGSGRAYRFVRVAGPGAVPKAKLVRLLKAAAKDIQTLSKETERELTV